MAKSKTKKSKSAEVTVIPTNCVTTNIRRLNYSIAHSALQNHLEEFVRRGMHAQAAVEKLLKNERVN